MKTDNARAELLELCAQLTAEEQEALHNLLQILFSPADDNAGLV